MSMRIGGLASGINTDEIIEKMMAAQRIPADKLKQQKQLLEWKRDDYRTLNTKILAFRDASFNMKLQSNYLVKAAVSSDANIITATANGNAMDGSYAFKVNELASGAALSSGQLQVTGATESTGATGKLNLTADVTLRIKNGDKEATIELKVGDTVADLLGKVNEKLKDTGVGVSYNKDTKSLLFINSKTGADSEINLKFVGGALTNDDSKQLLEDVLGFAPASITANGEAAAKGKNAQVEINGVVTQHASNTFEVGGMTVTAKQVSTSIATISVSQDTDKIFNSIKAFVEAYNGLIAEVNGKLSEKKYRDFAPLTDDQRKDMSEDDIKRWEEKAKSGMLARDTILSGGLSDLRTSMAGAVSGISNGALNSYGLNDIGISSTLIINGTVQGTYLDQGKLYIDEAKLRKAISENPDKVMELFTKTDGDASKVTAEDGIAERLHRQASSLISTITGKAGVDKMVDDNYSMGKELIDKDERIDRILRRLEDLETRYYTQFTAMEKYLNQMNAQSAWLTQQFSS